jgi:SagB-type dehydrogenase family enzyme
MDALIGREFLERTKLHYMGRSDETRGLPRPPLARGAEGRRLIKLTPPDKLDMPAKDLVEAINRRRSSRHFTDQPLSLDQLAFLLWSTQGIKEIDHQVTLRTVPSAGACHPLETEILINHVEGLQPGIYRYVALEHGLVAVDLNEQLVEHVTDACLSQAFVRSCAALFMWVAIPYRSIWSYQERAYRYIFMDSGHACQNLYLAVEALGCGCCAIGAFDDDKLNRLLGLDGREQTVIYLAAVGHKA